MNLVPLVIPETGVLLDLQVLDLRGLQERKEFRACQEDLELQAHLVLKVNQVWQWLRKVHLDREDRMGNQDSPVHQVAQVSPDNLVTLV